MARKKLTVQKKGHWRKAYTRSDGTKVKRTWVPATKFKIRDIGAPGRGPKLIKVKKGLLRAVGYSTDLPAQERHEALRRAVRKYGKDRVFRMLQAQVIYRKRTPGRARGVFEADRDWITATYGGPVPKAAIRKWKRMSPAARARRMPSRRGRKGYKPVRRTVTRLGTPFTTTQWVRGQRRGGIGWGYPVLTTLQRGTIRQMVRSRLRQVRRRKML